MATTPAKMHFSLVPLQTAAFMPSQLIQLNGRTSMRTGGYSSTNIFASIAIRRRRDSKQLFEQDYHFFDHPNYFTTAPKSIVQETPAICRVFFCPALQALIARTIRHLRRGAQSDNHF